MVITGYSRMIFRPTSRWIMQFAGCTHPCQHPGSALLPQMKPEAQAKAPALSTQSEYLEIGVPEEWINIFPLEGGKKAMQDKGLILHCSRFKVSLLIKEINIQGQSNPLVRSNY